MGTLAQRITSVAVAIARDINYRAHYRRLLSALAHTDWPPKEHTLDAEASRRPVENSKFKVRSLSVSY